MRLLMYASMLITSLISFSVSAAEFETRKFTQGQWFIYDQNDVKTNLLVSTINPSPQCYQIADILIPLENEDQALDHEFLQNAARQGLANYQEYCSSKGQNASKARNVVAFLGNGVSADGFGRVKGNAALVLGKITTSGSPSDGVLEIRTNRIANAANRAQAQQRADNIRREMETNQAEEDARKEQEQVTHLAEIKAKFGSQFTKSRSSVKGKGFFGSLLAGDRTKLTGAWSASSAECSQNILLLLDDDGKGRLEWWRDFRGYGMLPWRSGSWDLKSGTLTMVLDHHTEVTFVNGFEDAAMNETVQLELRNVSSDELRLASPGPNSPALTYLDADEKLFIRCE